MESQLTEQEKTFVNLLFHKGLICKIENDYKKHKKKKTQKKYPYQKIRQVHTDGFPKNIYEWPRGM